MNTFLTCLEVFVGRMLDVSIGSVRTVFLVKQKNALACILAFIEILIWFFVARQILTDKDLNILIILSYAGGYAFGTYVGGLINKYFVRGTLTSMVITSTDNRNMVDELKKAKFGVSVIHLEENKLLLLVQFKKKNTRKLKSIINHIDRNAFVIINESLQVENGYFN